VGDVLATVQRVICGFNSKTVPYPEVLKQAA